MEFASDWLSFTLGGEIVANMPEEAIKLSWDVILNVLFLRFSTLGSRDSDTSAAKLLLDAQHANLNAQHENLDQQHPSLRFYVGMHPICLAFRLTSLQSAPPSDFCWFDDLDARDCGSSPAHEEEASTPVLPDGDDPMDGTAGDHDYIPEFDRTKARRAKPAVPKKSRILELELEKMPAQWFQRINVFFYTVVNPGLQHSAADVVQDYCQMRDLRKRDYKSAGFQAAIVAGSFSGVSMYCTARLTPRPERNLGC